MSQIDPESLMTAPTNRGPILKRLGNALSAESPILLGSEGTDVWLGRGWAHREQSFCWTIGPFAEIVIDLDGSTGLIGVDCAPLILGARDRAQILLFADGVLVCAEVLMKRKVISFPVPAGRQSTTLLIWAPEAVAPATLDPTTDDIRELGFQIFSIVYDRDDN